MSLPLIKRIEQTGDNEWILLSDKNKNFFVIYSPGLLTCYRDYKYSGIKIYNHKFVGRGTAPMSTAEMLHHIKFKMNHDFELVQNNKNNTTINGASSQNNPITCSV